MGRVLQVVIVSLIFFLTLTSEAAYKIYLKNGSAITGVKSYEKQNSQIIIQFGGGSIGVSENDVLKIEEAEMPEKDFRVKEAPERKQEVTEHAPVQESPIEKGGRANALRSELESVIEELKTLDENEERVKASIEEKRGKRFRYNVFQLRHIEKEIEPLQQELLTVQQRKSQLIQRKSQIEGELRGLE